MNVHHRLAGVGAAVVDHAVAIRKAFRRCNFGDGFKNGNIKDLAECLEKATLINWELKSKEAIEIASKFDIKQIIEKWKQVID